MNALAHTAAAHCATSASAAYRVLAEPAELGTWALGCWQATLVGEDTVEGASLFDGKLSRVRVVRCEDLLAVDFEIADEGGSFLPRIHGRAVPGEALGLPEDSCVVTLVAWRPAQMDDERWSRLVKAHEVEILLLKARIEQLEA